MEIERRLGGDWEEIGRRLGGVRAESSADRGRREEPHWTCKEPAYSRFVICMDAEAAVTVIAACVEAGSGLTWQ